MKIPVHSGGSMKRFLFIIFLTVMGLGFILFSFPKGEKENVCILETNYGLMTFKFFEKEASNTCFHFQKLSREGFYNGKHFYRVVKGHVIQAGDGGENDYPTVKAEFNTNPHLEGTVGLARDEDPDSGSTEFYICLAPRPHLDGKYTVFGQLEEGYDVLRKIGNVEVKEQYVGEARIAFHSPLEPVIIHNAYLKSR